MVIPRILCFRTANLCFCTENTCLCTKNMYLCTENINFLSFPANFKSSYARHKVKGKMKKIPGCPMMVHLGQQQVRLPSSHRRCLRRAAPTGADAFTLGIRFSGLPRVYLCAFL